MRAVKSTGTAISASRSQTPICSVCVFISVSVVEYLKSPTAPAPRWFHALLDLLDGATPQNVAISLQFAPKPLRRLDVRVHLRRSRADGRVRESPLRSRSAPSREQPECARPHRHRATAYSE